MYTLFRRETKKLLKSFKEMKRFRRTKNWMLRSVQYQGFTLAELLMGALITSLTVSAGIKLSQIIVDNNEQNQRNSDTVEIADNTIDQIQQEIRNGEQLIDVEQDLPTGCKEYRQQGIQFLFAIDIPDQAMSLSDYDISKGKPSLKAIKCPIVYGIRKNTQDIELHRIGTDLNEDGYYMASQSSQKLILKNIAITVNQSLTCPNGNWKLIKRGGIEVCIDQRMKRMAKITLTVNNGRDLPGITAAGRTTQRQGSAMTEIMSQEASASNGNAVDKCKLGSGCNFGGQPITCDKTSFMIDVSGSMRLGNRIARAKRELLRAIDSCSDDAEINVTAFSSSGYATEKVAWPGPQKLSPNNRDFLRKLISGFGASGGTDPWRHTNKMMQDQNVKEIVLLSDGGTRTSGSMTLGGKRYSGSYAKSYQSYNNEFRSNNPVTIKTVSFGGGNYCGNGWMGQIADMNGGSCIVAP